MIKIKGIKTYPGGKGSAGTYQKIINEIRPHHQLIIPFLGNCGVVRNITRATTTIGIDISREIVDTWRKMKFDWINLFSLDAITYLEYYFPPGTVIYCDPPYPIESRSSKRKIYDHEMSMDDHERLLKSLKKQKCDVLISTYENDLYKQELSDWRLKKFLAMTRGGLRTEYLYMNYPEPVELHDYRFLGENFRERERISNKIKRHVNRLKKLPILERKAILKSLVAADTNFNDEEVLSAGSNHKK